MPSIGAGDASAQEPDGDGPMAMMDPFSWNVEGATVDDWDYGRCRLLWCCDGEDILYGGGFSLYQSEKYPGSLILSCHGEYAEVVPPEEIGRLSDALQMWLTHGDETLPRDAGSDDNRAPDKNEVRRVLRRAAWRSRVTGVMVKRYHWDSLDTYGVRVEWGREVDYLDIARFESDCDPAMGSIEYIEHCTRPEESPRPRGWIVVYGHVDGYGYERLDDEVRSLDGEDATDKKPLQGKKRQRSVRD